MGKRGREYGESNRWDQRDDVEKVKLEEICSWFEQNKMNGCSVRKGNSSLAVRRAIYFLHRHIICGESIIHPTDPRFN
ncbi:MAG: hypothetical protein FWG23_05120 [Eggerthellaceae bacterium]|nr:hypothetical protein [Eggerthellaceae bacterium]